MTRGENGASGSPPNRRVVGPFAGRSTSTPKVPSAAATSKAKSQPRCDGHIESPRPGTPVARESFGVVGWGLFMDGVLSRVDILLDGSIAGQARIGLARPDIRAIPRMAKVPAAAVCGFEWTPDPSLLPQGADEVRVGARLTSTSGATFDLSIPEEVRLAPALPPYEETTGCADRLSRRTEDIARQRSRPREGNMRVVAFTHRLDHGGAQRYFFEQVRYLMRDPKVSCTVVSSQDGVWRRRLETIGADVHLAQYPVDGILEYESAVAKLSAWASHHSFDAVFVNTLNAFIGADLGDRLGLPVAWAIHESLSLPVWWAVDQRQRGHPYVHTRLEHSLSRASALIFAADATKRLFVPYASQERMVTAPYGLELDDIDNFRQRFDRGRRERRRSDFPRDSFLLLCLGTVIPRKAQAVLIQAFGQVAAEHPLAHLILVGDEGGSYSGGINDFLVRANLGSRCTLLPVTSDAYTWHELADAFVLSSDIESSPIAILEAMAFETPVLASKVFGVPELLTDGRDGYLCEPNDVGDLASALDRVLTLDADERRRVALAGAERVRVRHDPERYARSFRRLLDDLVGDPTATPAWEAEPAAPASRWPEGRRARARRELGLDPALDTQAA